MGKSQFYNRCIQEYLQGPTLSGLIVFRYLPYTYIASNIDEVFILMKSLKFH